MVILIDQDNTIADFIGGFQKRWQERFPGAIAISPGKYKSYKVPEQYPLELKAKLKSIYTEPGFIRDLEPIPGSIEAIRAMVSSGHEVRICTSPLSDYENCVAEKYHWVEKWLGRAFTKKIILTEDKTLVRGDILIDDELPKPGLFTPAWQLILFDRPYNQTTARKRLLSWNHWAHMITPPPSISPASE